MPKEDVKKWIKFQSTYLYKVRPSEVLPTIRKTGFNPRTYIRYDAVVC